MIVERDGSPPCEAVPPGELLALAVVDAVPAATPSLGLLGLPVVVAEA